MGSSGYEEYFNIGRKKQEEGNFDEAFEWYNKVTKIKPDFAEAWIGKGFCLMMIGKFLIAAHCFDKALEIQPESENAWFNKAVALGEIGRFEEAIRCYNRALKIKPDYEKARTNKNSLLQQWKLKSKQERALLKKERKEKLQQERYWLKKYRQKRVKPDRMSWWTISFLFFGIVVFLLFFLVGSWLKAIPTLCVWLFCGFVTEAFNRYDERTEDYTASGFGGLFFVLILLSAGIIPYRLAALFMIICFAWALICVLIWKFTPLEDMLEMPLPLLIHSTAGMFIFFLPLLRVGPAIDIIKIIIGVIVFIVAIPLAISKLFTESGWVGVIGIGYMIFLVLLAVYIFWEYVA
jgi:hypothetical protein